MEKLVFALLAFQMSGLFFESLGQSNLTHEEITKIFTIPGGAEIKMIWVRPGSFVMGSPETEAGRKSEREVQHTVVLSKGFWLAETEVTQAQWSSVMGSNPSNHIGDNFPVDQVSYYDIEAFLGNVGNSFRLPTEAEWEYACRAGSTDAYDEPLEETTWHIGNSGKQSHPVAKKRPNAWGFYDMHGNILEWCSDWFAEDNTKDIFNPKGPVMGEKKVQRGGQFTGRTAHTRAADRQAGLPESRDFYAGFRLVRDGTGN